MSPVRYELGFYTPEDDILHSHHRENLKSYISSEDTSMTVSFLVHCKWSGFPIEGQARNVHVNKSYL
jgi:hypothetical protein